MGAVQKLGVRAEELIPPARTMDEITVIVPEFGRVKRALLEEKRAQLEARGLLDAGLVLVRSIPGSKAKYLQGYIPQGELTYGLDSIETQNGSDGIEVRVLGESDESDEADISAFVDRTPVSICAQAPMEYVVEMFGKLGLRYLMVTEEGSGALIGVVIKKASWLFFYCPRSVLTGTAETGGLLGWYGRGVRSCGQISSKAVHCTKRYVCLCYRKCLRCSSCRKSQVLAYLNPSPLSRKFIAIWSAQHQQSLRLCGKRVFIFIFTLFSKLDN
jgi:hypothetical protein